MVLMAASAAHAGTVETLLMPGKVSQAHIKQESSCANCHDRSNARPQSALCVDCHKDIAADVQQQRGYHGRMQNAGAGECRACHTEHKGRAADIVQLDRSQFNHRLTDFELTGAHASLNCATCHSKGEAFRKATPTCIGCHKPDDVHHGQFSQSCADCHGSLSWTDAKYDHDRTQFRLTGAHGGLACNACHIGGAYKQTPKSCVGCHATDDEHRGTRGETCAKCHSTQEWKTAKYDHLKETGFELLGAHDKIDCIACHRSGNYKNKIPEDCNGCHRADDTHAARFGPKCGDCHDNDRWRISNLDHAARYDFALQGAHAKLDCHACHSAVAATQKLGKQCVDCHRAEDPHAGKLGEACDKCHAQQAWRSGLKFEHDLSEFPLLGLHRLVSCAQCHATLTFKEARTTCNDCHSHDDVHKGSLGEKCEACHSPNGWPQWTFDHARQTHFALTFGHANLQCAACHREAPGTKKTSPLCVSCHRQDDRHLGEYGPQCDRCHSTDSWKHARMQ
jgi:hypothetical protein